MEKARMLGIEQAVVGGTEGGRNPTGVPPTTAAAAAPGGTAAGNGKPMPDLVVQRERESLQALREQHKTTAEALRVLHSVLGQRRSKPPG